MLQATARLSRDICSTTLSKCFPLFIGVEGTRLLREEGTGETPQAKAEEAPGPPAESECLQRK
ncbi:hypothetical protein FZC74_18660 [Sutcliffiella horikoshii]|uniref:Uncharacterized protein n=1 Tax=Sutcliffiella horikoshii TaxID=79883 RepID=A0A5D4T525_9BACI|nr:hypothetical protein FZC74_18660 [Sutcliffiella horikoshii]TYS69244.1 hypothetical protein FZC75_16940 [Sutcliffiella horikoshii]